MTAISRRGGSRRVRVPENWRWVLLILLVACATSPAPEPEAPPILDPVPEQPAPAPGQDEGVDHSQALKKSVSKYSGQVKYCYELRLKDKPGLEGRIELGWTLAGGRAEGVYVKNNDTGDSELAACIVRKVIRWKFPADLEGDVIWPFVFRPVDVAP